MLSSNESHAGVLAAFDDFVPGVFVVFLHDRGDENALGILVLHLLEFIDPGFEAAIGDELDVFPAVDFARLAAAQTGVARLNVDDFAGVEADRFADDGAPAFFERFADDIGVRARRAGADDEGIGKFQAVDGGFESCHGR